jgi:hypothetical protein
VEITAIGVVSSDYVADAASAVAEGDMGDTHFAAAAEDDIGDILCRVNVI